MTVENIVPTKFYVVDCNDPALQVLSVHNTDEAAESVWRDSFLRFALAILTGSQLVQARLRKRTVHKGNYYTFKVRTWTDLRGSKNRVFVASVEAHSKEEAKTLIMNRLYLAPHSEFALLRFEPM